MYLSIYIHPPRVSLLGERLALWADCNGRGRTFFTLRCRCAAAGPSTSLRQRQVRRDERLRQARGAGPQLPLPAGARLRGCGHQRPQG